MNISEVTNAAKVGTIALYNGKANRFWNVIWEPLDTLSSNDSRVYFFVVNGNIKKIGASECKGGIKSTMLFYETGLTGSPSLRSYGIHMLVKEELETGNKVEVYVIWNKPVQVSLNGLIGNHEYYVNPSMRMCEEICKNEYYAKTQSFPEWNFQENCEQFPEHIKKAYDLRRRSH